MRPLTKSQYEKVNFRTQQRELSYPEKVRQVVAIQKRVAPVYAMRGITIKPWRLDDE